MAKQAKVFSEKTVTHNGKPVMYVDLRAAKETNYQGKAGKWTPWGFMLKPGAVKNILQTAPVKDEKKG